MKLTFDNVFGNNRLYSYLNAIYL